MPATAHTISTFQVMTSLLAPPNVTPDELEEFACKVEETIQEYSEAFGASATAVFEPMSIEIDLSIDAVSTSVVNRRLTEIMTVLEEKLPVQALSEQKISVADPAPVS